MIDKNTRKNVGPHQKTSKSNKQTKTQTKTVKYIALSTVIHGFF